jgi:hypothetical protein
MKTQKYKIILSTQSVHRGKKIKISNIENLDFIKVDCLNIKNIFSIQDLGDNKFRLQNNHATLILEKC